MVKLLVVEDNENVGRSICDIFDIIGYDVDYAHQGQEGWDKIQNMHPDVIISDIDMPIMDGYEFLKLVRNHQETEAIPFIFLTGRAEREKMRRGMTMGADDFVTKPFSVSEIVASVDAILKKQKTILDRHETTLSLLRKNISYSLPHEMRTPLQSILGYASLMQLEYENLPPDEIKLMSDMIFKAGSRLERLTQNALTYAQIELISTDKKQQKALRNNILPHADVLITEVAQAIAAKWGRTGDLRLQLENVVLRISQENLTGIITELLDNAFKFSEASTSVEIRVKKLDDNFVIQIRDYGRGMTSEQVDLIGPYMQFNRVLYEQQGCGLGLTIAKRLVELHEGTFDVRSVVDEGTLIIIKLKN